MAGAVHVLQVVVVAALLVLVADDEADGRAERGALEHTAQELHRVALRACRAQGRAARAAAVQLVLHGIRVERQTRRAAVDDPADGRAVAFTEGDKAEKLAEGVAGHGCGMRWRAKVAGVPVTRPRPQGKRI